MHRREARRVFTPSVRSVRLSAAARDVQRMNLGKGQRGMVDPSKRNYHSDFLNTELLQIKSPKKTQLVKIYWTLFLFNDSNST